MRAVDIIIKKRDGMELSREEIEFFIQGYVSGEIRDYQASALLMAIYHNGMNSRETADLTMAMVRSGDVVDLSAIPGVKVDKHSTGGVGDTTTLAATPLAAACKVPIAKMSGRGLGHTGGTLDKLESIPGFRIDLSMAEFVETVKRAGLSVIGQTARLVPADKMLYALRDVTGTVDSLPLIASSIMSKKIAAGANAIVLDVKTGNGAFMETEEKAFALAREMVEIGTKVGRRTTALVTNMSQPLGMAVGNALEVKEAIDLLANRSKGPLREVSLLLAAYMVYTGGKAASVNEGREMVEEALISGRGLEVLKRMITLQGGNAEVINDPGLLPGARIILHVKAEQSGYIESINAKKIGHCALLLGAGRTVKEDPIDHGVGLVLHKRLGEWVNKGETLADFYINNEDNCQDAIKVFLEAITIGNRTPAVRPLVYGAVTEEGIKLFQ